MNDPAVLLENRCTKLLSEWLNDNAPIGEEQFRAPAKAIIKEVLQAKAGGRLYVTKEQAALAYDKAFNSRSRGSGHPESTFNVMWKWIESFQ